MVLAQHDVARDVAAVIRDEKESRACDAGQQGFTDLDFQRRLFTHFSLERSDDVRLSFIDAAAGQVETTIGEEDQHFLALLD
jgi:hypothetical protein